MLTRKQQFIRFDLSNQTLLFLPLTYSFWKLNRTPKFKPRLLKGYVCVS